MSTQKNVDKILSQERSVNFKVYDWGKLFSEYVDLVRSDPKHSLRGFCKSHKIAYAHCSKMFSDHGRLLAGQILAHGAAPAAQRLVELSQDKNKDLGLRAATAVLDRAGHSPQATIINLNNQVNTQLQIAPLFKENYSRDVNSFLDEETGEDQSLDPHRGGQTPTASEAIATPSSVEFPPHKVLDSSDSNQSPKNLEVNPGNPEPDPLAPLGIPLDETPPKPPDPVQALTGKPPKPEPTVERVLELLEKASKPRHSKVKPKHSTLKRRARR